MKTKKHFLKVLIPAVALAPVLFIAFQNAAPPDACYGSQLCDDIHKAMLAPAQSGEGLSDARLIDQAANRFGYGLSPLNRQINGQHADTAKVRQVARFLADSVDKRQSFESAHVNHLKGLFDVTLPASGMTINPIKMTMTDFAVLSKQLNDMRLAETDMLRQVELRRDITRARGYAAEFPARFRLLMSVFNSQRVIDGNLIDTQVDLNGVLEDFWFNHFNVANRKSMNTMVFGSDGYERTLHTHMHTTFQSLLRAANQHPAMLIYLDNQSNRFVASSRSASNQNLGRELLELHTLGAGPGAFYQQDSVEGSALMLTGLNAGNITAEPLTYGTRFAPLMHVPDYVKIGGADVQTAPVIMGHRFCLNSNVWGKNGTQPIDCPKVATPTDPLQRTNNMKRQLHNFYGFLASHPRTKVNICRKLTQRFLTGRVIDDPNSSDGKRIEIAASAVNARCLAAWGVNGDLTAIYKAILTSPEVWSKYNYRSMFKNPHELVISAVRASGFDVRLFNKLSVKALSFTQPISQGITALGMNYRNWETPTGYPMNGFHWISGGYLVRWVNTSFELANLLEISTAGAHTAPLQKITPGNGLTGSRELAFDALATTERADFLKDLLGQTDLVRENSYVAEKIATFSADETKLTKQRLSGVPHRVPLKTALNMKISNIYFLRK